MNMEQKRRDTDYIIPGSSFRLLVNEYYSLLALNVSIGRRLTEAKTEKDFLRLQRQATWYERRLKRVMKFLQIPEDCECIACDTIEKALIDRRHVIPIPDEEIEIDFDDFPDDNMEFDVYDDPAYGDDYGE